MAKTLDELAEAGLIDAGWAEALAPAVSSLLASAGLDGSVRLWDPATGRSIRTFVGHKGGAHSVAFSADGSMLASAGADGDVRLKAGGDIDLLICIPQPIDNDFLAAVALETDLQEALGDQKIDILLLHPGTHETPIHRIAQKTGVLV